MFCQFNLHLFYHQIKKLSRMQKIEAAIETSKKLGFEEFRELCLRKEKAEL